MSVIEFKHILVPTDFGEHAAHALDVALALAGKLDAKLTILHAFYLPPAAYDTAIVWPLEELAAQAQKQLDSLLADTKLRYPKCEAVLARGYPAERIVESAKRCEADLIVIGTHGRRGISRALLGSVAERVVRTSPVPVLTVSADAPSAVGAPADKSKR